MQNILDGLNDSQRSAVTSIDAPLLIVAGPGTGKTLTIVRRIAYLIEKGTRPESIVAVTFTNRAAREMRFRIHSLLGNKAASLFIGTFHMLGLGIIKEHYPEEFSVYSRDEQTEVLKSLFKISTPKAIDIVRNISNLKNNLSVDIDGLNDLSSALLSSIAREENEDTRFRKTADVEAKGVDTESFKQIYELYQANLRQNNAFDFDDLIQIPIELLQRPEIAAKYHERFRYLIVDEYQDINPAQYLFLKSLAGERGNICAVGDSDQAIYAFRGADIKNFLNFEHDFSYAKRVTLSANYRSSGIIVGATNQLIKNNLERIEKRSQTVREPGKEITVISVPDERAEGEFIIQEIEGRLGGTSHYQLMRGGQALQSSDPAAVPNVSGLRDVGRDVKSRNIGMLEGLHCSYRFSDFAVVFRTKAQARAIEEAFNESGIPYQLIAGNRPAKKKDIISFLRTALVSLSDTSDLNTLLQIAVHELNLSENDVALLQNLSAAFAASTVRETISSIIIELELFTSADAYDPRADAVLLTTLHSAKGLEFKTVFIAGMEDGLVPYTRKNNTNLEEERRLLYVGMTRAKDELVLLHARSRFLYGQRSQPLPSPFLNEIPREFVFSSFIPDRVKREKKDKQMDLF